MRILHTVEQYAPSVGGMQEVVKQLSEQLVQLGHSVTVATRILVERDFRELNGVQIKEFAISGNQVKGYWGDIAPYQNYLLESDFDVITNFAGQQWATDLALPILNQIKAKKVFVPTGFSGLYDHKYKDYFRQMGGYMRQYDMNVFLSNDYRDINYARDHAVKKLTVIPNGASAAEFRPESKINIRVQLGIPEDHLLILLVGSHTGLKGHKEAIRIFSRARLPKATLLIVANRFGGRCDKYCTLQSAWLNTRPGSKRAIVKELSRPETVAAYKAADIFLFPSNIECSPLVLFECMAARLPFLSTDVGNAQEIINWSRGGLILPTRHSKNELAHAQIKESALMLEKLAMDPEKRTKLATSGYEAWQKRFNWEIIAKEYEKLYLSL